MAIENIQIIPEGVDDYSTILHPETNTGNILGVDGKPMLADYNRFPGFGITAGSANVYSLTLNPAPTAYVDGMCVAIRVNVANTGASTLNVNGLGAKSIRKANGAHVAANNLLAGYVYTLRYSAFHGLFLLQGEGGEYGTALAADVLAPKTIGTENGLVSGTMPNRGALNQNITTQNGQINIASGYYTGGVIKAIFTNLIAANIRAGVNIGGVIGNLEEGEIKVIRIPKAVINSTAPQIYNIPNSAGFKIIGVGRISGTFGAGTMQSQGAIYDNFISKQDVGIPAKFKSGYNDINDHIFVHGTKIDYRMSTDYWFPITIHEFDIVVWTK